MTIETVKIAVSLDDGSLSILQFVTLGRGSRLPEGAAWVNQVAGWWKRDATDELVFGEICRAFPAKTDQGAALPKVTGYKFVTDADIPTDRTYRDAWVHDGKTIIHDMSKARDIHRNMLRHARAPKLVELDAAFMKAAEHGNPVVMISAQKQDLRDVTKHPDIEAAQTVDELKQVTLGLL